MKKNKLYTVNQWNQPAFMQGVQGHIFDGTSEPSNQMFRPSVNFYNGMKPLIQNAQANQAQSLLTNNTPQTRSIGGASGTEGGKSSGLFSKEAWKKGGSGWAVAGNAANVLGSIETGEKRGMWDTLDPMYHLSGGRESKVGDSFSDTGVMLTQAGLSSGNPWLALAGAASKVVGDLTNAAFGLKIDHKRLNSVNEGVGIAKNFTSDASSFDDIKGPVAIANADGVYKGGWFSGDKAVKKNAELLAQRSNAVNWMDRSVLNNINNLAEDQMSNNLGNYAAFGGLLDQYDGNMGAIEYGLISDYLTQKKRENNMKSKMSGTVTIPAFMPNSYAIGGDLQTNGGDFTSGLTRINAGGSHSENPNEGVQLGVDLEGIPNLVEENETVWNDYVFSARIPIDQTTKEIFHIGKKREMTYADLSKKLEKEIAERVNDPISKAGFEKQMQQLAEQQERQKQEMEAERAKAVFEALSPEEQTALMQRLAQEEAQANMSDQQEAVRGSSENTTEMQGEVMPNGAVNAVGQPEVMEGQPVMAYGGEVNRFDKGGMKQKIYNLLGLKTQSDWNAWAKNNKLNDLSDFEDWDNILQNQAFVNAITKDNPALRHAIENKYDFGLYKPGASESVTFDDNRGNWDAQTVQGWWGSTDPAWQEVIKNNPKLTKDTKLSKEELANLIRSTDAFKRGTQWLQDSEDNRLNYLKRIINNPGAPDRAVAYARKFIDENGWKEGAARDYETIFNNPSGRAANPGTYWKTPIEAVRNSIANNYVINRDGTIEALEGDTNGLTLANTYQWADPQTDYTNNYYRRSGKEFHAVEGDDDYLDGTPDTWNGVGDEVRRKTLPNGDTVIYHDRVKPTDKGNGDDTEPKHRTGWLRYAGLFGPAVGLGMQALGIGKPDTSAIDAAIAGAGNVNLARWKPLGNYLTYRPLDIWYQQNALNAQSRATDRALLNASGANSGAAMAGLLSNGYNSQIASGNLFRQAQEYNDALRNQVAQFNRGTDQFNSEQFGVTSRFNADARNNANRAYAQLRLGAASQKADMNAGWNQGIYGNVSGLFKGIGDMGRENEQYNWLSDLAADGYFGNLGNSNTGKRWVRRTAAKGGKLKKKGLTI